MLLDDNYTARLVDFGSSYMVGETPEALSYLSRSFNRLGTIRWAAPEHLLALDVERTTQSDIYTLGNLMLYASPPFITRICSHLLQVLSGKLPWSEMRQDVQVVIRLSQGHKPARPESRPIRDTHWALIEQCWSSIDQRPHVNYVVSSLEDFLRPYPVPQPLRDTISDPLLGNRGGKSDHYD